MNKEIFDLLEKSILDLNKIIEFEKKKPNPDRKFIWSLENKIKEVKLMKNLK